MVYEYLIFECMFNFNIEENYYATQSSVREEPSKSVTRVTVVCSLTVCLVCYYGLVLTFFIALHDGGVISLRHFRKVPLLQSLLILLF